MKMERLALRLAYEHYGWFLSNGTIWSKVWDCIDVTSHDTFQLFKHVPEDDFSTFDSSKTKLNKNSAAFFRWERDDA